MPSNPTADAPGRSQRVVLVTGPSGAGRSTAIRALEDIGYESIDNLPLRLLPRLLDGPEIDRPMALGVDARNRDFAADALFDAVADISRREGASPELLYLDCRGDVLLRRFSETRRRHPLAPTEDPAAGIEREFEILASVRTRADVLIDTSDMTPHDLRAEVSRWFGPKGESTLSISVQSFSYKRGLPRGMDLVFDCRFLTNPYWVPELRHLTGRDARIADFVAGDKRFADFYARVYDLCLILLPAYGEEGKSHLSIGFGCTGGRHRSVTVTEKLGAALAEAGWQVSIRHRELSGGAADTPETVSHGNKQAGHP